jgi:D-alanyl-D-alanine carboxypeptidase
MSQNLYAETLLKTVGLKAGGMGSMAAGRAVIDATLAAWGVAAGEAQEVDGSGLSLRRCRAPVWTVRWGNG